MRLFIRGMTVFLAVITAIVWCASLAQATVTPYTSESAFLSAVAGLNSQTLDFETETVGTTIPSGSQLGGITFTYDIFGLDMTINDTYGTTSGTKYLGLDGDAFLHGDEFTMSFGVPLLALGFNIIVDPTDIIFADDFELSTSAGSAFNSATKDQDVSKGGVVDGNAYFLGLVVTDPSQAFSSADLLTPGAYGYVYNVDDITTAPVPEPGTFLLVGTGLLGAAFRKRIGQYCKKYGK